MLYGRPSGFESESYFPNLLGIYLSLLKAAIKRYKFNKIKFIATSPAVKMAWSMLKRPMESMRKQRYEIQYTWNNVNEIMFTLRENICSEW